MEKSGLSATVWSMWSCDNLWRPGASRLGGEVQNIIRRSPPFFFNIRRTGGLLVEQYQPFFLSASVVLSMLTVDTFGLGMCI